MELREGTAENKDMEKIMCVRGGRLEEIENEVEEAKFRGNNLMRCERDGRLIKESSKEKTGEIKMNIVSE